MRVDVSLNTTNYYADIPNITTFYNGFFSTALYEEQKAHAYIYPFCRDDDVIIDSSDDYERYICFRD
jgi:hypothetical protein